MTRYFWNEAWSGASPAAPIPRTSGAAGDLQDLVRIYYNEPAHLGPESKADLKR